MSDFLSKSKIPHNCHAYYTDSDTVIVELDIPPFTTSSSVAIGAKVSSDTISNDANKEIGITDTTNETSVVAESVSNKEEEIILESSAISNEPEVAVEITDLPAELPSDSNENPSTISPSFDNSISETIDPAEDATNLDIVSSRVNLDDVYSPISKTHDAIYTVKATNTKSPFTSFAHTVTSKFSSLWHSFTNMFHSENESTGDTVLDVNSSSDSSFADNHDVKEDGVHCTGDVIDAGMLSVL
ncbi:MAG: hypothetical protein LN568_01005 [Rickettsia endosymbiont of Pseudomimeciton antennatum]|nr:hypothetical protein [Rickettsia endosymbiont of Pseudomimeciton antennatum]